MLAHEWLKVELLKVELKVELLALVVWGIRIQPTFALVRVVKGD